MGLVTCMHCNDRVVIDAFQKPLVRCGNIGSGKILTKTAKITITREIQLTAIIMYALLSKEIINLKNENVSTLQKNIFHLYLLEDFYFAFFITDKKKDRGTSYYKHELYYSFNPLASLTKKEMRFDEIQITVQNKTWV